MCKHTWIKIHKSIILNTRQAGPGILGTNPRSSLIHGIRLGCNEPDFFFPKPPLSVCGGACITAQYIGPHHLSCQPLKIHSSINQPSMHLMVTACVRRVDF